MIVRVTALVLSALALGCSNAPPRVDAGDGGAFADGEPPRDGHPTPADARDASRPSDAPPAVLGEGFTDLSGAYEQLGGFAVLRDMTFGEPEPSYGVLADLDGDGTTEVLLSTDYMDREHVNRASRVMRYDRMMRALAAVAFEPLPWSVRAVTDLDGDGRMDLVGFENRPVVAWGTPDRRIGVPVALNPAHDGMNLNFLAGVYLDDLDADGWLDVLVSGGECCPGCRSVQPYLRTGLRSFRLVADALPDGPQIRPYTAGTVRVGAEGPTLLVLGGGCDIETPSPMFYRPRRTMDGRFGYEAVDPLPRMPAFHMGAGVPFISRYIPMGATAADLDGDGRMDLSVALDPTHAIFRGTPSPPWEDRTLESGIAREYDREGVVLLPWVAGLVDVDLDGRGDLVITHGHDLARWADPRQRDIPQYVTVQRNLGGFHFEDVTSRTRLDRRGQWRGLAIGDLDRDGDADLVVGGDGELPRVYRNEGVPGRHGVGLRLRGSTSNSLGLGTRVEVTAEGVGTQHFVAGNMVTPSGWNEPLVFAGLGAATRASRVRLTWPSGVVQELADLMADRLYVVDEPELITVEPASRHVMANGRDAVTVRVTPRSPNGMLASGVSVEAALIDGATRTMLTATRDASGAWAATVPPRASAGSAVIEVRVNGAAAGVRPRVWWD